MKVETAIEEFEKRNPDWDKSMVYSKKYDVWYSKPKKIAYSNLYGIVILKEAYEINKNTNRISGKYFIKRVSDGRFIGVTEKLKDAPEMILDYIAETGERNGKN